MESIVVAPEATRVARALSCEFQPIGNSESSDNDNEEDNIAEKSKTGLDASKKRKRPTASLLKNAMEELDKIWAVENHAEHEEENMDGRSATANETHERHCEAQPTPAAVTLPDSEMDRVRQTSSLLVRVFQQDIHGPAIRALVANEDLRASLMKLKTELETVQKENERLRRSEKRSKESIKNLLKAVGTSVEDTKDASQRTLVEAKMRADLLHAVSERDAAKKDLLVAQRSLELARGDTENLKKEKTKLQHDKLRLEREVRSARALAEQLSSSLLGSDHSKDDLDYYKGKSKELQIHLQGMTARLAEKNQEIQTLRRCNDRNFSQQRLEALRAAGEPSTDLLGSEKTSAKRSRKSY